MSFISNNWELNYDNNETKSKDENSIREETDRSLFDQRKVLMRKWDNVAP